MMGFPNRCDAATLSGGTWTAGLPRANLQTRVLGEVARTADTALSSTKFDIDLGAGRPIRAVSVRNHNLSLRAKYRVRASTEPAATNLIANPRDYTKWSPASSPSAPIGPYAAIASDGTASATTITDNSASLRMGVLYNIAIPADTVSRVFSVLIKKTVGATVFPGIQIQCTDSVTPITAGVALNTNTGEVADQPAFAPLAKKVTDYGDYWRVEVAIANVGYPSCIAYLYPAVVVTLSEAWRVDLSGSVTVWHSQVEVGTVASSIIPDNTAFVSRSTIANDFNAAGVLGQIAINAARSGYSYINGAWVNQGLTLENAATNAYRNSAATGVVAGTPGTMPSYWYGALNNGLSREVVGSGVEGGLEYVDIRFFGVTNAINSATVQFDVPAATPAAVGQTWALSVFVKLIAGTLDGLSPSIIVEEYNSSPAWIGGNSVAVPNPTNAPLSQQRCSGIRTAVTAGTAYFNAYYRLLATAVGVSVDVTLRFSLPQLERDRVTSPIKTSGAAVTRAADVSTSSPATRPAGTFDGIGQVDGYDSGWRDVWPVVYPFGTLEWEDDNWWSGKYTDEERAGYMPEGIHLLPKSIISRYWRIEFDDTSNPAGYLQFGRLFIGPVWQPSVNAIHGADIGWETETEVQEARGGAEYFDRRTPFRVTRFTLDWLDQDEAFAKAFELQRRAGVDQEILYVHDPEDTVQALRRQFTMRLRRLGVIEYPYFDTHKTAWEGKELL